MMSCKDEHEEEKNTRCFSPSPPLASTTLSPRSPRDNVPERVRVFEEYSFRIDATPP